MLLQDQGPREPSDSGVCVCVCRGSLQWETESCNLSAVTEYIIFIDFPVSNRFPEDCQFSGGDKHKMDSPTPKSIIMLCGVSLSPG